jgi:hypothetical protein
MIQSNLIFIHFFIFQDSHTNTQTHTRACAHSFKQIWYLFICVLCVSRVRDCYCMISAVYVYLCFQVECVCACAYICLFMRVNIHSTHTHTDTLWGFTFLFYKNMLTTEPTCTHNCTQRHVFAWILTHMRTHPCFQTHLDNFDKFFFGFGSKIIWYVKRL